MRIPPALREFALMALPCALFLGVTLLNSNTSNEPNIDRGPVRPLPVPTPTPTGFYLRVDKFEKEKMTPQKAAQGADTSVHIETWMEKAPKNLRWYTARRLVAIKNGRARVLWNGEQDSSPYVLPSWGEYGGEMRGSTLLFKLRNVPKEAGELVFAWDALAQPVKHKMEIDNEKFVDVATLQKAAKNGGVRVSRRLILRNAGQTISAINFPDNKPLSAFEGKIFLMNETDEMGNDVQIELYLSYPETPYKPEIVVESPALVDTTGRTVNIISYQGGAVRQGGNWV